MRRCVVLFISVVPLFAQAPTPPQNLKLTLAEAEALAVQQHPERGS